ncbi:N-acetyl-alpha-D-glucosaminyl L-malate deacetylase 1 [Phycisphaerales bacterium]|nr:N-acetyl-alpha-D-glucosaminyl L-malate deacetylase 1 [Phycisphaerales bacterium]
MNVLVLAAHPDDAEIGMGGTISLLASQGHEVLICDLTDGSPTPRGDRESRVREAAAALACLQPAGGRPVRRVMLDLPNRTLTHTIESRHKVAGVIRAHQASVLFIPHWEDAHPDHVAATRIGEDARFDAKLTKIAMPGPPGHGSVGPPIYPKWVFYYDVSHLRRIARPDLCIDITGHERKKQASVRAYRSQFGPWDDNGLAFAAGDPKAGPPADPGKLVSSDFPERLLAYAQVWGSTIGVAFAEPFFTREPVGLRGLSCLAP